MPFDPTLPLNGSNLTATEIRNQLNALNDLITDLTARVTALEPPSHTATGFGDAGANGLYQQADLWYGRPLYLNAVSGYCLAHDGIGQWKGILPQRLELLFHPRDALG